MQRHHERPGAGPAHLRARRGGARRLHRRPEAMRRGSDRAAGAGGIPRLMLRGGPRGYHALRRHHHQPRRGQPQRREGRDRARRAPVLRR